MVKKYQVEKYSSELMRRHQTPRKGDKSPYARRSRKVLDSALCISDSRYWIPDPLSVEHGFRIPIVRGIPDSKAQDSGFHKQKFSRFRNLDYFSWGDTIKRTQNGEYLDTEFTEIRDFSPKDIALNIYRIYMTFFFIGKEKERSQRVTDVECDESQTKSIFSKILRN